MVRVVVGRVTRTEVVRLDQQGHHCVTAGWEWVVLLLSLLLV